MLTGNTMHAASVRELQKQNAATSSARGSASWPRHRRTRPTVVSAMAGSGSAEFIQNRGCASGKPRGNQASQAAEAAP